MAERLRHRGPDGFGAFASPSGACCLGHARLKVIDLETGEQPMGNEDGTVQVVFNGEIYNFRSLREELAAAGHRFRTRSDTEVIVHGYEEWGDDVVKRLDGMFAFGLWDDRERRLLLARDRAGKKPLFLYREPGLLAFASEMKALWALPEADDSLDPAAFPLYLAYGYVPAPGTFHRRVTKLPPAHTLMVDGEGRESFRRYWNPDFRPVPIPSGEARETVRTLVRDAVKRRLLADVPLGAFLSGGVDSSIVVGLMAELESEPVRTFSISFVGDAVYDESAWARRVARRFGTDHTEFRVDADSFELTEDLVRAYDEPFGDSSAIPTWLVSRLTRQSVTVALTGDGGDELFAGYPRFGGMRLAEALPAPLVVLGHALSRTLPHHPNFRHPTRRALRFFRAAGLPLEERWLRWVGYLAEDPLTVLKEDARDAALEAMGGEDAAHEELLSSLRVPMEEAEGATPMGRALAMNFHTYLPEDLLVKADRNSMAHGLELRSPLLDTELVEFAASLPDSVRTPRMRLKGLLKDSFRDLLPDGVLRRSKMGFAVPLPRWFREGWRPRVEETLLAPDARTGEWLRADAVRGLWDEHQGGRADHAQVIWALLTLELWLRTRGEA